MFFELPTGFSIVLLVALCLSLYLIIELAVFNYQFNSIDYSRQLKEVVITIERGDEFSYWERLCEHF